MNPWKPIPLIRLLIPFLGGVICALIVTGWVPGTFCMIAISAFLEAVLFSSVQLVKLPYALRLISGVLTFSLMFSLGILTVQVHLSSQQVNTQCENSTSFCPPPVPHCQYWTAEILDPPRHTSRSVRLKVVLYETDTMTATLTRSAKALLFLEKDSSALELRYGNWIFISTTLKPVKDESNPYGFDPAGYYGREGVFSQGWISSADWKIAGVSTYGSVRGLAFALRDRLLGILKENSLKGEEFAVASALLLGYTEEIGQDLKRGFAASGAMHILSVSGMHVGIIYLFLETFLAFLNRRNRGPAVKAALMIVMIWCYAMVTGLSPPVFRAALMLSLIILGRAFKRKSDALNVVGGSLFVILILDPSLILHLGFQFSYMAVLGILVLYKPLFNLIPVTGWILTRLWGLVAVSVAAQIATFPMALYTFHQFPNYFILTNILVLPLSSLVIYSGIGVLIVSPVPALSSLLGGLLSWLVGLLNMIIRFLEGLPGSTSNGIYLSFPDLLMLYLVIVVICCFLFSRKTCWIYLLLALAVLWSSMGVYNDFARSDRIKIVVFQIKEVSQYVFVKGESAFCIKDYQAACVSPYAREVLSAFIAAEGITRTGTAYLSDNGSTGTQDVREFYLLCRKGNFLQFAGQRIGIVSPGFPISLSEPIHLDLVILRKNPSGNLETIVQAFSPHQIVIDPTNSWYNTRNWMEQAESLGVPCYNVLEEGAFLLETGDMTLR